MLLVHLYLFWLTKLPNQVIQLNTNVNGFLVVLLMDLGPNLDILEQSIKFYILCYKYAYKLLSTG